MGRTVGLALGGLMLVDGVKDALAPRFGFRIWERIRPYFPESWNRLVGEYARLSDTSIRYLALWEVAMAGLVLWLASQARD